MFTLSNRTKKYITQNLIDDCIYEAIFSDEILEWWLVTAPFARLLQAEGEYILEKLDCYWWGRTTSGMAIYMDSVITDIVKQLN